jgi:uroporphyrinogen-III synthase
MINNRPWLQDWQVVILRPAHQAGPLRDFVSENGGTAIVLPMIELSSIPVPEAELNLDLMIVTSPNSVHFAPLRLLEKLAANQPLQVISMGQTTTAALTDKNIPVFFTAPIGSTSESLLAQDFLQGNNIAGKTIGLLSGEGGRILLAQTLQQRQAHIQWFQVYRQSRPERDLTPLLAQWQQQMRFCFVVTSLHCFENLLALAPTDTWPWLQEQTWIVVSARIETALQGWGAGNIIVAKGADQASLATALQVLD